MVENPISLYLPFTFTPQSSLPWAPPAREWPSALPVPKGFPPRPNPNDHRREARGLKSSRLRLSWARLGPPELTLGRANRHPWAVSNDSRCHQSSANTYDGTDQMDRRRPQLDGWITAPSRPICRHQIFRSFAFETQLDFYQPQISYWYTSQLP